MFGVLAMLLHHPLVFLTLAFLGVFMEAPKVHHFATHHPGFQQKLDAVWHGDIALVFFNRSHVEAFHNATKAKLLPKSWMTLTTTTTTVMEVVMHTPRISPSFAASPITTTPVLPKTPLGLPTAAFWNTTTKDPWADWHARHGKWHAGSMTMSKAFVCEAPRIWGCPHGYRPFEESCYRAVLANHTFQAAKAMCMASGGYLVNIESQRENDHVSKLVGCISAWIGIEAPYGYWQHPNGARFTGGFQNWAPRQQSAPYHNRGPVAAFIAAPDDCSHGSPDAEFVGVLVAVMVLCFVALALSMAMIGCQLLFACCYQSKVTNKRRPLVQQPFLNTTPQGASHPAPDFHFGLCGCCEDTNVCLHSWCCLLCRAGDTHTAAGVGDFWSVIFLYYGLQIVGSVVGAIIGLPPLGRLLGSLGYAHLMAKKRQALRQRLGLAQAGGCEDLLAWWCCTPCVVAQEAREVDQAAGVDVRCCCTLVPRHTLPLVGPSVASMNQPMMLQAPVPVPVPAAATPMMTTTAMPIQFQPAVGQPTPVAVATVVDIQPPSPMPRQPNLPVHAAVPIAQPVTRMAP